MKRQDWDAAVEADSVSLLLQLPSTIWRSKLAGGLDSGFSASHAFTCIDGIDSAKDATHTAAGPHM